MSWTKESVRGAAPAVTATTATTNTAATTGTTATSTTASTLTASTSTANTSTTSIARPKPPTQTVQPLDPKVLDAARQCVAYAEKVTNFLIGGVPFGAFPRESIGPFANAIENCMSRSGFNLSPLTPTLTLAHDKNEVLTFDDLARAVARSVRRPASAARGYSFDLIPSAQADLFIEPEDASDIIRIGRVGDVLLARDSIGLVLMRNNDGTWNPTTATWQWTRSTAWTVGPKGAISRFEPTTYVNKPITTADLHDIHFAPDNVHGFAVGDRGVVLRTTDGGNHWELVTREYLPGAPQTPSGVPWPPIWYIAANAFITLPLLGIAMRRQPADRNAPERQTIAGILTSDKPLEEGDPDPLNLRSIALAISRFLRNENTLPPLTIAITGEWGSGKSSLMNLVKADLADFGFRPVWFNPWHHQKEEHLLASLLQAIRLQATPQWWRPENLIFRARLIWIRGWKHRATLLLLILLVALALGYEKAHDHSAADSIGTIVSSFVDEPLDKFLTDLPDKLQKESLLLLTLLGVSLPAARSLMAFASTPAKLLASLSGSARIRDLDAEMSYRHRFAAEFRDVTEALGPRSLLIFIDDLDRCQSDSVREVLEAVNFLVSSGDCFVIMGMDRNRVERYLALGYKEISEKEPDFARKYLDKLINIEVPVPEPTEAQSSEILAAEAPPARPTRGQRTRELAFRAGRLWPVALAAFIAYAGFRSGQQLQKTQEIRKAQEAAAAATTSAPVAPPSAAGAPIAPPPKAAAQPGLVVESAQRLNVWIYWPTVLLLIPLIMVGWWLLTRPPDLVLRDSPDFVKAIRIWQPLIAAQMRTPRALKRFMNRLRYLAMRQRPQREGSTIWRQLKAKLLGKPLETIDASQAEIPEWTLVALSTLHDCAPQLMTHDILGERHNPAETGEVWSLFLKAQREHEQKFGWDVDASRENFLRISSENVRAN